MPPDLEESRRKEDLTNDGSWIDARLLQDILEAGATVIRIDVQPATSKGENFLSVLHRTHVNYRLPESEEVLIKHLIVKDLPASDFLRKYVAEVSAFDRELTVYSDLLPRLYAFADSRLGDSSFKRFSAEYYTITRPNTLILGDLNALGFIVAPRKERLNFAHSKLVVQNLARFHALSLTYSEIYPEYISQFDGRMYSEKNRDRLNQFFPPQIKSVVQEIRKWGGFEHIANKLEVLQDNIVSKLLEVCNSSKSVRNVLVHGDCWVNNILFKYSEFNRPTDLRFVDFQMTHETSPAFDLNYFIFSSLQTDVREIYFENLLHAYCDEFKNWARKLGYKGPLITFEELNQDIQRTLIFGFASVVTTMAIVLADPEDSPDLGSVTEESAQKGEGMDMFEKVYRSASFREAFIRLLPYFDNRGVFD